MALFLDLEQALFGHLHSFWTAAGAFPHKGGTIEAPIVSPNASFAPTGQPWAGLDVLFSDRFHTAGAPTLRVFEARGILQVNCYVPDGWGTELLARMSDRVAEVWRQLVQPGFHVYATVPGRELPAPPDGHYGRSVDSRFLWISGEAGP